MSSPNYGFLRIQRKNSVKSGETPTTAPTPLESQAPPEKSSMSTREWMVFNHSRNVGHLGTVVENSESNARCAALSKFGIKEDDEFLEYQEGVDGPIGILLTDDFDVRPV